MTRSTSRIFGMMLYASLESPLPPPRARTSSLAGFAVTRGGKGRAARRREDARRPTRPEERPAPRRRASPPSAVTRRAGGQPDRDVDGDEGRAALQRLQERAEGRHDLEVGRGCQPVTGRREVDGRGHPAGPAAVDADEPHVHPRTNVFAAHHPRCTSRRMRRTGRRCAGSPAPPSGSKLTSVPKNRPASSTSRHGSPSAAKACRERWLPYSPVDQWPRAEVSEIRSRAVRHTGRGGAQYVRQASQHGASITVRGVPATRTAPPLDRCRNLTDTQG